MLTVHCELDKVSQRYCIPNGADDTTNDRVLRLDAEAHPLYYINDDDIGTTWISSVFANTAGLDHGVSITIDLQNGQYQVFYIILQFFSPHPEAIRIERKKRDDLNWEDWQYFAKNCSIFGMDNNGSLEKPDSVNCLQLPSFTPYSRGNLTFSVLTPEPNHRPGYNDFYNTPSLQEFVKATQVRIHLHGQYHTTESWCNRCLPLYNDKPFRPGDQVHAYNCKPCRCYGHAVSCHYDLAMDPFPQEHYRGSGGVCDNCQHNTAGRNCELCKDFHYRQAGADLSAIDVCKPCDCYATGTKNKSLLCDNIGGQCNCKRHVSGRQCNQCQEGFYNLQQSNPDGCSPCNCNTSGTVNGDITCHQNSGQCKCKANVIGLRCDSCNFGFKALRYSNEDGCEPCWCNSHGSVNQFCNPLSGQCNCKERVKGLRCDTCIDDFYGLDVTGCKACECNVAGSFSGTVCNEKTGQCACKPNVGGRQCDECLDGYHKVQENRSFVCLPCNCDKAGTLNGTLLCDKSTGQCPCKAGVTGLQCNQCVLHTYNLSVSNLLGCQPCDCDALGTLAGTVCDHVSGQCVCLPQRQGRRCDECKPAPFQQPPPTGEVLNSSVISLSWSSPDSPNSNRLTYQLYRDEAEIYTTEDYYPYSIIIRYELYMRKKVKPAGNFLPPEIRVFQSSGWLSPQPVMESPNENALAPPQTSTTVTDLEPFTEYEFYVLAVNMAGSISSDWISGQTGEAAPVFMPSPSVFPLSPYSLNVSWEKPEDNLARGEVMGYSISLMTEQRFLPPFAQVLHIAEAHELSYIATGLKPYRTYNFTVTLCNQIGCVTSEPGMGQTLAADETQNVFNESLSFKQTIYSASYLYECDFIPYQAAMQETAFQSVLITMETNMA
ncbi:usherin [Grus japonensis]|uniref:Usherin n=1 Tax=Grus japonensis TaxID=30415 RepID=A0ABC9WQH7_GRUJA